MEGKGAVILKMGPARGVVTFFPLGFRLAETLTVSLPISSSHGATARVFLGARHIASVT